MQRKVAMGSVRLLGEHHLGAGDDLTDLANSMKAEGLRVPVLVDPDMTLIDGYRRLQAARNLGWDEVDVVVADTYDEACAWIGRANTDDEPHRVPVTPARVWAVQRALRALLQRREAHRRSKRRGVPRTVTMKSDLPPARQLLQLSLGLPSEAYLNCVGRVFGDASRPGRYQRIAQGLRDRIVFEGHSVYTAYQRYQSMIHDNDTKVMDKDGQSRLLGGAAPALEKIAVALDQVGEVNPGIDLVSAQQWRDSFVAVRKTLFTAQNKLTKHINQANAKEEGSK